MAHYLNRQMICDRLRLSRRTSYNIVGSAYGSLVSSDEVINLLNRAKRATSEDLNYIPSDLMTADELATALNEPCITASALLAWTRRTKNVVPHFKLTNRIILFSRSRVTSWLDDRSRLKSLKVRVA